MAAIPIKFVTSNGITAVYDATLKSITFGFVAAAEGTAGIISLNDLTTYIQAQIAAASA